MVLNWLRRRGIISSFLICVIVSSGFYGCSTDTTTNNTTHTGVAGYTLTHFTAEWKDIAATGSYFLYNDPDTGYTSLALPFDFPYDDSIVRAGTNITIGVNGAISLSPGVLDPNGSALANPAYPGMLCIFSGNLVAGRLLTDPSYADTDFYEVDGVAPNRVLTVEYHWLHFRGTGGGPGGQTGGGGLRIPMQVKLYETTGTIEFIYKDHNYNFSDTASVADTLGIGLNGFHIPFVSNVYASGVYATPATDLRWTR
ncbi:MAG TPA: hypothetical protein VG537_01205 [Candidatus Kapabacteria bacterium]|jgi:hypothetical protein|nr:hypothetical protein [Candidatus Kapabacteria bacterium]